MQHYVTAWLLLQLLCFSLSAQDPFSTHFYNNQSAFNPALTGQRGALSVDMKAKSQWSSAQVAAFRSGSFNLEESLPCALLDYGLHAQFDEEGDGRFRTYDVGFRFAGTIPIEQLNHLHNIRIGASLQWSYKTIDYSRLVFSDQLDAKYGNMFGSSFVAPNDGQSNVFFTPAVGIAYRGLFNSRSRRATTLTAGLSLHNAYSLGADYLGNEESILGLGTKIPPRFVGFIEAEILPFVENGSYLSIRPLLLYQRQSRPTFAPGGSVQYWEAGTRFSLSRVLTAGFFYHFTGRPTDGGFQTNWMTISLEMGTIFGSRSDRRVDLGFAYSNNFSGLRNAVGPLFEASVSVHLLRSPGCRMLGRPGVGNSANGLPCPAMRSTARRKLYENIWYE